MKRQRAEGGWQMADGGGQSAAAEASLAFGPQPSAICADQREAL